jgi:hypothetical protein
MEYSGALAPYNKAYSLSMQKSPLSFSQSPYNVLCWKVDGCGEGIGEIVVFEDGWCVSVCVCVLPFLKRMIACVLGNCMLSAVKDVCTDVGS